jgi:hypothetical protein
VSTGGGDSHSFFGQSAGNRVFGECDSARIRPAEEDIAMKRLALAFVDVLPPDYETRIKSPRPFGRLSVSLLGRRDVIVMKFFSGRPKDLRDLEEIAPTATELAFTARQLPRLAKVDAARSERMQMLLDAWPGANAKEQ